MAAGTFKGGIHPYEGKELTKDKPTTLLLPKGDLVYPMSQHIGNPAKPIVAKGDKVLVGQKIGEADGVVSACIISSVSGTVKAVEPRLNVAGTMVESIVVENDNAYTQVEGFGVERDYETLKKEQIRSIIKEAGIVGMGGAGFPTHIKLTPKDDSAIDYLIINGSECEPYLTSDYRMMLEETNRLIKGIKITLRLFENAKAIIAVEDNKPEAISMLTHALRNENRIELKVIKTKYPQGAERVLIYAITGRKMNSTMLPSDIGCIVNNVDTMISVCRAVAENTPLIKRVVTVSGDAVKNQGNFIVLTGTNYSELVEAVGGFSAKPAKLISGGPMMGLALYSLDIPVTKTSSALLAFASDEVADMEEGPCIRCGRCVEVCPGRIVPQKLMEFAERFDDKGFEGLNGMECCECGCCSYICPAGRHLTQAFKQSKRSILNERKK
ncbi:electron transport complex subunit RsxC [Lachnoclostridium phytofermentans]|uniref:Ion-translocating oxidoreductase complex subunit C n=1 Tax=Lachnoclostridium phytofermentans (strain ATCC 700394 / DSM 18823 / ISDg) TaxID=357809 RepID=A9KRW7_LACP7|nr:electron transport complex subunit RsxC [Lachnoclostridium phytofermentans]ABX40598.1 electron transport complex, RnfABCDGE type, C subunit [Lachnoclostridium phytofermentans ISDg]